VIVPLAAACFAALLARPEGCPSLPEQPPISIPAADGRVDVTIEAAPPPSCFNVAVITWTDGRGTRELYRGGDESITTARAFSAAGGDFVFLRRAQQSASALWTYSELLSIHAGGRLEIVDVAPRSTCEGFELPSLGEPTGHGGYFVEGAEVRFAATYAPNRPDMAYVSARLRLERAGDGYVLRVSAGKVERPG
jgi:hypothetical protein